MHKRFFLSISFFLLIIAFASYSEDSSSLSFGPTTGKRLIFTLAQDNSDTKPLVFQNFIAYLQENPPQIPITILLPTENSTNSIYTRAQQIFDEEESAIIVFFPHKISESLENNGEKNVKKTIIEPGTQGKTSPLWLTKAVTKSMDTAGINWQFSEPRIELYRMGWSKPNPILSLFFEITPLCVGIHLQEGNSFPFEPFMQQFAMGIPEKNDNHYLIFIFQGVTYYFSEIILVASMIIGSAMILLFLFIFSFMFGKHKDQHVLDFLRVWWLPLLFLIINITGLYVGGQIVSSLFVFRFGEWDSWQLLPYTALAGKLIISWFFVAFVSSFHQLFHLPEDDFIYGYIASLVCLVNIFIFSASDFSLSITFLAAYFISFIAYHFKHPLLQILSIIVMLLPFYHFIIALGENSNPKILIPLYTGENLSNIQISFFVMPFQLLVSRVMHKIGIFGRKSKFYIPLSPLLIVIPAIAISAYILFVPAWSVETPLTIAIHHEIIETKSTITTKSPVKFENLSIRQDNEVLSEIHSPMIATTFVQTQIHTRRFLERQINTIVITPQIKPEKMEITVFTNTGIAVYTASHPFELHGGGDEAVFVLENTTNAPFTLEFSSDIKSNLHIRIVLSSKENPYGIAIHNSGITSDYRLTVQHSITVFAEKQGGL